MKPSVKYRRVGENGRREFGAAAEGRAVELYRQMGFEIVARNVSARCGEIDFIAQRDRCLAFVEVRARRSSDLAHPLATVSGGKRRRILLTALRWLAGKNVSQCNIQFDVVALSGPNFEEVVHVPHAFDAGV